MPPAQTSWVASLALKKNKTISIYKRYIIRKRCKMKIITCKMNIITKIDNITCIRNDLHDRD
jgi:hypothetical protein